MKKAIVCLVLLCLMIMCFSCGTRENEGADNNATETPVSALTNASTPTFTDTPTEVITERPTSSPVNHPYGPVTRENAEKVTNGMTMIEVTEVLGKGTNKMLEAKDYIYLWPIEDGCFLYTWWDLSEDGQFVVSNVDIREDENSMEGIVPKPTLSPDVEPYGAVTRDNVEKITVGMTIEDVINILGKDKGVDQGSGAEIYVWPIDDGQYLYTWWNTVGNTKYLSSMKVRDDFKPAPLVTTIKPTATPTPVLTPTPVVTATPTPVVTETPTPVVTATPVVTPTPMPVVTETPTPVVTATPTPVVTETPTPVVTATPTPTVTATPTPTVTATPTPVVTATPTPVVIATSSPTPAPNDGFISSEDIARIQIGMTKEEVESILGMPGTSYGSGAIIYGWPVSDGTYLFTWWDSNYPEPELVLYLDSMRIMEYNPFW